MKSSQPLVSVIIPTYNAEAYIEDCINSVINQTYKKLEIILINDGSTDSSGNILDKFMTKDMRIRTIHKINGGVSSARNFGLNSASGDFVMFVDSDDWLDLSMVEKMVKVAIEHNTDIVSCAMRYINMAGKAHVNSHGLHPLNTKLNSKEASLQVIGEFIYGGGSLCCRLISSNLTIGERFIESMRISEDQEWLLRVVKKTASMVYIPESFYNVRVRSDSATTTSRLSDASDIELVNNEIVSWAHNNGMTGNKIVSNALFVRSRLQYSSSIRAGSQVSELAYLRKKMINTYKKTDGLHIAEKVKYYISLLPPGIYLSTRLWLKRIRSEAK